MNTILHLTISLRMGGRERFVVDLANALSPLGYKQVICCLNRSGECQDLLDKNIEVIELNKKPGLDYSIINPLNKLIKQKKINILHAHNPGALFYAVIASKWGNIKPAIINTEHGYAKPLGFRQRLKDAILYRFVAQMNAVSQRLQDELTTTFKIEPSRIRTIRNGVKEPSIENSRSQSRAILGLSPDYKHVGIVASLTPVKNHQLLLEAFRNTRERLPETKLWVVGDGELRRDLEKRADELGLSQNVVFMGLRTDVPEILNALDLFVLCSLSEGISISLLEAMAAALPIVATRVGGNSEVIENAVSGVLVESNHPEQLSEAIIEILSDDDLASSLANSARERFIKHFSIGKVAEAYQRMYQDALKKQ